MLHAGRGWRLHGRLLRLEFVLRRRALSVRSGRLLLALLISLPVGRSR